MERLVRGDLHRRFLGRLSSGLRRLRMVGASQGEWGTRRQPAGHLESKPVRRDRLRIRLRVVFYGVIFVVPQFL